MSDDLDDVERLVALQIPPGALGERASGRALILNHAEASANEAGADVPYMMAMMNDMQLFSESSRHSQRWREMQ
jgi:hypothetical protein